MVLNMLYKLESLRGLAALLVVIYHTPYTFFGEKTAFLYSSWLFVDFFFVLSGFVMSLAYRNRIADGLSFTSYIIPRFFRLYPLHLFVILLWIPFIGAKVYLYRSGFGGVDPLLTENGTTLFSSLFMLNSLGVNGWNVASWSISAEWWTYILFFGVCYVLSKSRYYAATILIAAVSTYFVTLLVSGAFVPFTWDYGILRCVPAFLLGAFVFEVYSRVKISSCIQLHELISVALVISAILLCSVNRAFALSLIHI